MNAMERLLAVILAVLTQIVLVSGASLRSKAMDARPPSYMSDARPPEIAKRRHDLGIDKGEFLANIYTHCTVKYNDSQYIALTVLTKGRVKESEALRKEKDFGYKVGNATAEDKKRDAAGDSKYLDFVFKRENADAEAKFYAQILANTKRVLKDIEEGNADTALLRKKINGEFDDLDNHLPAYVTQEAHAKQVYEDALKLWQQWKDSTKDYNCGPPPVVDNIATQCKDGNTKFSVKCLINCLPGYDGNESINKLRCRKEGKFGKQLYGEWKGRAACIGRLCGIPGVHSPPIDKSKTPATPIRFPNSATYTCFEGYSQNGYAKGPKSFVVPCGTTGFFEQNMSHQCQRVKCGPAPPVKGSNPIKGTFYFSDVLNYTCMKGHTVDGTPGGLKEFVVSCQATGRFTATQECKRVRCGIAPELDHAVMKSEKGEKYFADDVDFKCKAGYTTDQVPTGPKKFTLTCGDDGEFALKGGAPSAPIPRCAPVSAGKLPEIAHGIASRREMFFGDTETVTAELGYSYKAKPDSGLHFVAKVSTEGAFLGLLKFEPVDCGAPPAVEKAKTTFTGKTAVYRNRLQYECESGYSTDKTASHAAKSFTIMCEPDASFSRVPNLGKCVNVDDCASITCGAHGSCVDHINNYTCDCERGFEQRLDNVTKELMCGNIDDCGAEACGVGKCIDQIEGFKCECPTGYEEKGEGDDKTCMKKLCGTPPRVDNALTSPLDVADVKASYEEKILYACDMGYTLDGTPIGHNHFSITCQADKAFTATKTCQPIKCGEPAKVEFATFHPETATFNKTIKYHCEEGYTIDEAHDGDHHFSTTCLVSGEYSEGFECLPVNCGEPPDIPQAARPAGSLTYKQSATYECYEGYSLDGTKDGKSEFTVKCNKDGKLDKLKSCNPKVCGVPTKHIHALHATTSDEGAVAYPRITEVTCRDGFTVDGSAAGNTSFVVKCLSSGVFDKYDKNECQTVRCGKPPDLPNASLSEITDEDNKEESFEKGILNYEERAFYKCEPGFTAGGEPEASSKFKVECLPTGEFSAPPADMQCRNVNDCELHTCGPKGACVDLIGPSPAYTCDCEYGFEIQTNSKGEKNCGNTDDCKDKDCGVGVCKDLIGDYTCICPIGHMINRIAGHKTCVPVTCAASAPSLAHGKLMTARTGAVMFPQTLHYKCDHGYSMDGSVAAAKRKFDVHCKPVGELAGMSTCQKVTCGTPRMLPFTALTSPGSPRREILFSEKAEYKCFNGYTVHGKVGGAETFSVECEDSGVLTDPQVCEPVKCGRAPDVDKAVSAIAGDVFFGMNLVYKCQTGYSSDATPFGSKAFRRDCKKDGKFSDLPEAKPCKPMSGGHSPIIADAVLKMYGGEEVKEPSVHMEYPHSLEYKCKPGYSLTGAPPEATKIVARVNAMGKLNPVLPSRCQKITFVINGQVKNARNGRPLHSATVRVGGTTRQVTCTGGFFRLTGIEAGNVTLVYERDGYITNTKVLMITGNVNAGGAADISMSPVMRSGEWRAIVKWGVQPTDLDTYGVWGWGKTCWWNTDRTSQNLRIILEHDDTSSYGPETLYFKGMGKCVGTAANCDIKYMINDYTETGRMKDISEAHVTLYTGSRTAGEWDIKNCLENVSPNGNWWHVFTLDGKTNKLKWHCGMAEKKRPTNWGSVAFGLRNVSHALPASAYRSPQHVAVSTGAPTSNSTSANSSARPALMEAIPASTALPIVKSSRAAPASNATPAVALAVPANNTSEPPSRAMLSTRSSNRLQAMPANASNASLPTAAPASNATKVLERAMPTINGSSSGAAQDRGPAGLLEAAEADRIVVKADKIVVKADTGSQDVVKADRIEEEYKAVVSGSSFQADKAEAEFQAALAAQERTANLTQTNGTQVSPEAPALVQAQRREGGRLRGH